MRNSISRFLLIFILFLSCSRVEKKTDLLYLKINRDGLVDVYDSRDNKVLIKNINASFSDGHDYPYLLLDSKGKIVKTSFSDTMGEGTETVLEKDIEKENLHLKWRLRTFRDKPVLVGKLEVLNKNNTPKRINRLNPLGIFQDNGGVIFNAKDTIQYLEIEPETWADKHIRKLKMQGMSKFVTGIATPDNKGVVIGCISVNRFRGIFEFEDQRNSTGLVRFNTYHDIDDHLMLGADKTLSSEWIYINCVNDVFTGLETWAQLTGKSNNAVVSDPPAVGFYTWYYYRDYVSEKIMLDNARFLAENRDRFPVNYVHIDWGWQRKYSSGDTAANEKFPHGLRWLAGQIRDLEFTPSIWCNPFMYATPTADAPVNYPEIFLKDTEGNLVEHEPIRNIMANAWGDAEYMISPGVINVLDVSNPGSYDFLERRYEWVRSMGYDMAMMDFVIYGRHNHAAGQRLKYPDISTIEGIRKALFAARDGLGEGGNVLGCGTIYETAVGTSNLTRISYDATANWACVKIASRDLIIQYFMNKALWTNYADGIFVRDKSSPYWGEFELDREGNKIPMYLTDDEAQFYAVVTGLSQAAVMYTEDIQRLKPDRQWLLSMIMPIYRNGKFRPVDLFKTTQPKTLQLVCEEGNRNWIVAAGLNWSDNVDAEGLNLSLLDLKQGLQYHAFDVFRQKYLGIVNPDDVLGPVDPHGVLLANLVPDSDRPQVIGSDLHISQGGMEISNEIWDESNNVLTVTLNDLYGRKGHILIHVPSTYGCIADDNMGIQVVDNGEILKIPVVLDGEKPLKLNFNRK